MENQRSPIGCVVGLVLALLFWLVVGMLIFSPAHADPVERVNREVNYMTLRETICRGGVCFDGGCRLYAREKRRRLIAKGYAPDRLVIWIVSLPASLHTVLVLDGDTVLDNLWIEPQRKADLEAQGYRFDFADPHQD